MTALTQPQKDTVLRKLCERAKAEGLSFSAVVRGDAQAAITAVDNFFEANLTAINNAFPEPAKSALTAREKAFVVADIISIKYGV